METSSSKTMNRTNNTNHFKVRSPILVALICAVTALQCQPTQGAEWEGRSMTIEHRLNIPKGGTFKFSVPVGSVVIENHDQGHIEYRGEFKARSQGEADRVFPHLEEKQSSQGDRTELIIQWANRRAPKNSGLSGSHILKLPRAINIEIHTAGGSVKLGDRAGSVVVASSGGSIRAGEIMGFVKVKTSGGSIAVDDCHGNVTLNTSGGSIKTGNVSGSLVAKTSGGSIKVGHISGHVQARTSGGSIHATLMNQIEKPVDLSTSGGDIHLKVNPELRATLDAKTSGGRAVCDLPMKVSGKSSKTSIKGAVNGGGPKITMRTSGGSIRSSR